MVRKVGDKHASKMQQNTHRLAQLGAAAALDVPNQTPMPQLPKQMLNTGPMPPMHIIVPRAVKVPFFLPMNGTKT